MILKSFELALRLQVAAPWLDPGTAYAHAEAAEAAATEQVPSELLLGIAFVESRYDPTTLSRVEQRIRRTGRYSSTTPPAQLDRRASLFCGPLQTFARSWKSCLGMRNLKVAYAAGVAELSHWLRDRRVRGDVARALAGHGCGNHGVLTGACNGYPRRVLAMTRQLRFAVDQRPGMDPRPRAAQSVAARADHRHPHASRSGSGPVRSSAVHRKPRPARAVASQFSDIATM